MPAINYRSDTETSARTSADILLNTRVDLETSDRIATDVSLDSRLDTIEGYRWCDLRGELISRAGGSKSPTFSSLKGGNVNCYYYIVNSETDQCFHIPHDYVLGTDLFLHLHWGHNGTDISGNHIVRVSMIYSKGHNQSIFPITETVFNMIIPATNLTIAPRYSHIVSEVQISSLAPTAVQLNSNLMEPDGILLINTKVTSVPSISGAIVAAPYWLALDLHYLSNGDGTVNKSPNFYI